MPMKPARLALLPLLVSTLLLGACQESEQQAEQQQQQQTPTVGVVTLRAEHFLLTNDLPGRTTAYRIAEVRPQVNGILEKRLFEEGAEVEEGQQLYQIDDDVYQAALKSAEASSISTRSLAERYGILVKENAVSQQEYDEARAAGLQAQAALDEARINVRYTKVLAPISGRIGRSAVSEGALVTSGQSQQLATIQQLDPIYVDITQSSREMLNLRRDLEAGRLQKAGDNAAAVTLTLEDGSTYSEQGKLEFSEVSVDEGTGSVTLRAVFPNPDRLLLPGMFVHAELVAGSKSDAILAPQQGITRTPRGNATALVVNDEDKVESRDVVTERTVGNRWLIRSGLNEGDRLITEGLQYVRAGVSVNVEPAGNVAEPAAQ
ncbi:MULTISPECIES: efflux RND transporter periplasmic adaptor subunit [Pseudomonas]|uniref:Efflux transporter periplasmic adaptor subunit n=1 Tax=Pseudomonas abyssi TaxID=170540 RepID=A0A2A3MDS3_9PSED|nr:efflux RND transporter periplasmic adaptor subunit [Pseudomonas abyssi]MAD00099.1 efflux RND transporter periplasmic adaptor subunit [Pseudomonadales bacterium]PBK02887.1 efflux transporter periplasmic adaptor subunit [Pseudomonas abyssi]|tara:strand:- start:15428 stop:16555 length:1128 start_codon:yes stop_codon:yes gene_type:complete